MFLIVSFFATAPLYLLDSVLMPQLTALGESYSNFDATAQQIAGANRER